MRSNLQLNFLKKWQKIGIDSIYFDNNPLTFPNVSCFCIAKKSAFETDVKQWMAFIKQRSEKLLKMCKHPLYIYIYI